MIKQIFHRRTWLTLASTIAVATLSIQAIAQSTFPMKPIIIVVPYAAGGPTDVTARRLATGLASALSATVIVENKPGAATTVGTAHVSQSQKDGHTLLFAPGSTTSINPFLFKNLPYKIEDFSPISQVSKQSFVVTTGATSPFKTLADFIAQGKSLPGGLTYGTTGTGSMTNVLGELVGQSLGIKVTEVPYKGTSPATIDLIGGRIHFQPEGITSAIPMHSSGKTRALAQMSETRSPKLPDVPTFRELGYPDLIAHTTFGLLAPAGTPDAVIRQLHSAVVAVVKSSAFADRLTEVGEIPETSASPSLYREALLSENRRWGSVLKQLNIKVE